MIVIVFALGAITFLLTYESSSFRQARRYAEQWTPILRADSRFANVYAGPFTGMGGSVMVHGRVRRMEDAEALRQVLEQLPHKVSVGVMVMIEGERYWRELPANTH